MIRSFRHSGLQRFFETGSAAGIRPSHANRLRLQLGVLDQATGPSDLPIGWHPHRLKGKGARGEDYSDHYAITVSGNWRLVFRWSERDVELLDYLDYH